MKKIIIALVAVLILLILGGGGAYYYFFKMRHNTEKTVSLPPPKPIMFAQIGNLVVSVPTSANDTSDQVFIELSVQFATTDTKAIASFNDLLPIIQAEMVNLLMKQTAVQLMNPNTHAQLSTEFLTIVNGVLSKAQDFHPVNPFTAAYITNIVQQN